MGITLHEHHAALEALEARAPRGGDDDGRSGDEVAGEYTVSAIGSNGGDGKDENGNHSRQKGKAPRPAGESQRARLVEELLEALDAVELCPPAARPPAGLETSTLWGSRRAADRSALERLVGSGGGGGGGEGGDGSGGGGGAEIRVGGDGEAPRQLLGGYGQTVSSADVEVLRRLGRRVAAARRALARDGGGVLDRHAAGVAAAALSSSGRSDLVGASFDELPDAERVAVQRAVADAIGDTHVSPREMRRLLEQR